LESLIRARRGLKESTIAGYSGQLLRGVAFLHSQEIAHRDIKCESLQRSLCCSTQKSNGDVFGTLYKLIPKEIFVVSRNQV